MPCVPYIRLVISIMCSCVAPVMRVLLLIRVLCACRCIYMHTSFRCDSLPCILLSFDVYLLFVLVVDAVLLIPLTQLSCQHVPSQWGRGFMALPLCYYCVNNVVLWTFLDVLSLCYSAPTPGPVGFMAYIVKNTHYL